MPGDQAGAPPSPQLFFETVTAFHQTEALKAAIQLEIFTAIGEGNQTAAAIARRCQAAERGTRILCDALVIMGFLKKELRATALPKTRQFFSTRNRPPILAAPSSFWSPRIAGGISGTHGCGPQRRHSDRSRQHRAGTSHVGGLCPRHGAHDEDAGRSDREAVKGG